MKAKQKFILAFTGEIYIMPFATSGVCQCGIKGQMKCWRIPRKSQQLSTPYSIVLIGKINTCLLHVDFFNGKRYGNFSKHVQIGEFEAPFSRSFKAGHVEILNR